ncbi:MAG: formylglycine-generating enzyme family protein, partial [Planctomycetia bacterium]|nr:formylglycine-generating enzyme family protein [Planctomycetia bacterium]
MRVLLILAAALALPACGREGHPSSDPKGVSPSVPPWAKVAPIQVEAAKRAGVPVAFQNAIGMRFVLIPEGTFTMGDAESEPRPDEVPHKVTLTKSYYMAITETTNFEYRKFKAAHDSRDFQGDGLNADAQPVAEVSYNDAIEFARWLSSQDPAHVYRLPTEAEWEYACRAGTTSRYWWGD